MTVSAESRPVDFSQPPQPGRSRWTRLRVALLALAVLVVGAGISAIVYVHTYQPLQPGNYGGGGDPHLRVVTDGVQDTRRVLFGPPGTTGRFQVSIRNDGPYDVHVLGLGYTGGQFTAMWAPDTPVPPTGYVGGTFDQAHRFPATLVSGHQLTVWIVAHKPSCPAGSVEQWDQMPLRWSALGVHHEWDLPLTDDDFLPVAVCAPRTAARHIDRSR